MKTEGGEVLCACRRVQVKPLAGHFRHVGDNCECYLVSGKEWKRKYIERGLYTAPRRKLAGISKVLVSTGSATKIFTSGGRPRKS